MAIDGTWFVECLVTRVWDSGARLEVPRPADFTEFVLLYAVSPMPVYRWCKKVWTRGSEIIVDYQPMPEDFRLESLNDTARRLFGR